MVTNLVWAPPSLTPGSATGEVAISFIDSGGVTSIGVAKPDPELAGHGDVEQGVDLVLAFPGRDLADGEALVASPSAPGRSGTSLEIQLILISVRS